MLSPRADCSWLLQARALHAWVQRGAEEEMVTTPLPNRWSSPYTDLQHCSLQREIKPPHFA